MSTSTTRYTANATVVISSLIKGGSFVATVAGSKGEGTKGGSGGKVVATIPAAPSSSFTLRVGTAHYGGVGRSGTADGGASSALVNASSVVLVEAGGGGGQGYSSTTTGNGGSGGVVATSGYNIGGAAGGTGANGATRGTGGAGTTGAGSNGVGAVTALGTTNGGAGYTAHGGGGGGGYAGGGGGGYAVTNTASGGGGGGSSYINSSITSYTATTGANASSAYIDITQVTVDAPLAPTLVDPFPLEYINASSSFAFTWTYNADVDSGAQNAFAMRIKSTAVGSTYLYWNGTNFSSSTPVWNSSTDVQVLIPSGSFTSGTTYNWSIATQEDGYNIQGPFASDSIFVASPGPSATYTFPTTGSTISLGQPSIVFTANIDGSDTLTDYRLIIYTEAQQTDPTFSPGTSDSIWDSGTLSGGGVSNGATVVTPVTTVLASGFKYYIYGLLTETGSIQGEWSVSNFYVQYDEPSRPILEVVSAVDNITLLPYNNIVATAQDNLLTTDMASFEGSTGTFVNVIRCTPSQSSSVALDGQYSLKMLASSAGSMKVQNNGVSCRAGIAHTFMLSARAGTTSRKINFTVNWYNTTSGLVGTDTDSLTLDLTSAWSTLYLSSTSPVDAVYFNLNIEVEACSSGEAHYIDCIGAYEDPTRLVWSRGGMVGNSWMFIEYSNDGTNWLTVRGCDNLEIPVYSKQITVPDYELIPNAIRYYRASVIGTI